MSDTWITDISHFLDEDGHIVSEPAQAKQLGDYFAAIVMMVSFPDPDYPPEYKITCRRRPNRKPCKEEIAGWIEPDSDDIFWICPKCQDRGRISNWRGTIYDMQSIGNIILSRIYGTGRGSVFTPTDFLDLASRQLLDIFDPPAIICPVSTDIGQMEAIMKSQDIVLLLKLISLHKQEREPDSRPFSALYTVRALAEQTGISKSEVSNSLNRCAKIGLVKADRKTNFPRTNSKSLTEFIIYGLKYVFPAEVKEIARGIPTSFAAPVLKDKIMSAGELIYVWPDAEGKNKGQAILPLCRSVAHAIAKDQLLYELLALVDAIRLGNPREVEVAVTELQKRMKVV